MEPISFSLALAGIPGIFKSAIDGFQCVQLSRTFHQDFGFRLAKLEASQMQLTRWGEAIGVTEGSFDQDTTTIKGPWNESDLEMARVWLEMIVEAFDHARNMSSRFEKVYNNRSEADESLEVLDQAGELDKADEPFKRLILRMSEIIGRRREKLGDMGRKAQWALYRKADFESLIASICDAVENLVNLFPALHSPQTDLCQSEVQKIGPDCMSTLTAVLGENDQLLRAVLDRATFQGHSFLNTVIEDSKHTTLGNEFTNDFDAQLSSMTFNQTRISKSENSVLGHKSVIDKEVAIEKLKLNHK